MKLSTTSLITVFALSWCGLARAAAQEEVPSDLIQADKLEQQLIEDGVLPQDDPDALDAESYRPRPIPRRPVPRPVPRPMPRPVPRPRPVPPPYYPPRPALITCYADDAYGRVYAESGYASPRAVQEWALQQCYRYSGTWCRELGCRR